MLKIAAVAFLVSSLWTSGVLAAGDSAMGRKLAQEWCTSCHIVGTGTKGADVGPPFATLAANPAKTETYLKNWIQSPHPPMPNFDLSTQDAEDLAAYIRSLNPTRGKIER